MGMEQNSWITWKKEYSIGITEIDEQHMELIKIMNSLHEAINRGSAEYTEIKKIYNSLMRYVNFHFVSEEVKFIQSNYPDYKAHKALHDSFVEKIGSFQKLNNMYDSTHLNELLAFLKTWLLEHIMGTDKAYVPHLLSK